MREDLGDGYAETLRAAYPEVPESADLVLYWWHKAAGLVRAGQARRFGLITTNSLRQTFARRVVQFHLARSAGVPPALDGRKPDGSAAPQDAPQPSQAQSGQDVRAPAARGLPARFAATTR